jgi:class 3 adenylate cyclase/tetratricopeptide (TPR) repeat protein
MNPQEEEATPEAGPGTRRWYLAVVFADLCGSTARSLSMEAELYADLLNDMRRLAREIVPRHGGTVLRTQGDGMMSIFGYPTSSEDDSRRAIEATLELHAAVRRLKAPGGLPSQEPIALHSGIHAGRTLMRPGGLEGALFELVGPVPNIAAYLSKQAEWDEVLVSEETLGPRQRHFVLGEARSLELPGRAQPLSAVRVLDRVSSLGAAPGSGLRRARAPLAGRLGELLTLARHLRGAASGQPRLVMVVGDPGLGKTRLLEEFLHAAAADVHAVHRGYCESELSAEPLQPFLQIVRTLVGITPGLPAPQAAASVEAFVAPLGEGAAELRDALLVALSLGPSGGTRAGAVKRPGLEGTVAVLRFLFDRLARMGTQIVFIDDWQWADDASRQVLHALMSLERPLLVVLASRSTGLADPPAAGAELITLEPLALEEASATISKLLPSADPFAAGQIHRYAGGIPLYIEELCHVLRSEGSTARLDRLHPGTVRLNALIEARVARLEPEQASLARTAAIIGNVFPGWLLERLTGVSATDPLLRSLAEHDLVFPDDKPGMLRFKHGIARDVIYESIGLREKTSLHRRIAEALRADAGDDGPRAAQGSEDLYETLAYHYGAAGQPRDAARYAELAGDKAMASSALDRARAQYRAALDALDTDGLADAASRHRWVSIVQRLGMACVFDPIGLDDGLALFERAVELARSLDDVQTLARAEYWLTYIAYARGEMRISLAHGEQALALAEQAGDVRLAAQVRATLGQAFTAAADYPRALPLLDQSVDQKRQNVKSGTRLAVGSAYALATKGLVLGDLGEFDAAHACLDEALALVDGSGHQVEASSLGWLTMVLLWQGRWAEAIDNAARSLAIDARCKSTHLYAMHLAQSAYAQWMLGGQPEALQALQDATAWIEARHGRLVISLNHGWLADALVSASRPDAARAHAAKALRRGRALDHVGEAMACRAMARAAMNAGDAVAALRHLAQARRAAAARSSAHEQAVNDLCEAEMHDRFGRSAEARQLATRAGTEFARMKMGWHLQQVQARWP